MRLHTLTGAWLLLLPSLWGIALFSDKIMHILWVPVFIIGALSMRSAGCIINDIIDCRIDKKVERTKNRPLAVCSVTKNEAVWLAIILLSIAFIVLCSIAVFGSIIAIPTGLILLVITLIYPFGKRFTQFPQLILATVFNSGDLLASIAINQNITLASLMLYIGSGFWILYYDTIYAHQDKQWDQEIGVGSMALTKFGSKKWLLIFCQLSVIFWLIAGALSKLNIVFYFLMLITYTILYRQIKHLDLNNVKECMQGFKFNEKIGLIVLISILLGKV